MRLTIEKIRRVEPDILYKVKKRWKKANGSDYRTSDIVDAINARAEISKIDTRYRWSHVLAQLLSFYPAFSINSDTFEEYVDMFFDRWDSSTCNNLADSDNGRNESMLNAITLRMFKRIFGMQDRRLYLNRTKIAFKYD